MTELLPPVAAIEMLPAPLVMLIPDPAVNVVRVKPVPLPMSIWPFVGVLVRPVPPFATATVPVTFAALPLMLPDTSEPGTVDDAVNALVPLPLT